MQIFVVYKRTKLEHKVMKPLEWRFIFNIPLNNILLCQVPDFLCLMFILSYFYFSTEIAMALLPCITLPIMDTMQLYSYCLKAAQVNRPPQISIIKALRFITTSEEVCDLVIECSKGHDSTHNNYDHRIYYNYSDDIYEALNLI